MKKNVMVFLLAAFFAPEIVSAQLIALHERFNDSEDTVLCIANWNESLDLFSVYATKNGDRNSIWLLFHEGYYYLNPVGAGGNFTSSWKIDIPSFIHISDITAPDSIVYFCGKISRNSTEEAVVGYFNIYRAWAQHTATIKLIKIPELDNLEKITQIYANGSNKVFAYGTLARRNQSDSTMYVMLEGENVIHSPHFYVADLNDERPYNLINVGVDQTLVGYSAAHHALTIRRFNYLNLTYSPGVDRVLIPSAVDEFAVRPLTAYVGVYHKVAVTSLYQYMLSTLELRTYVYDVFFPQIVSAFSIPLIENLPRYALKDISYNSRDTLLTILCNKSNLMGHPVESAFIHFNPFQTGTSLNTGYKLLPNVVFNKMKGITYTPYGSPVYLPGVDDKDILAISDRGDVFMFNTMYESDCFESSEMKILKVDPPRIIVENKPLVRREVDIRLGRVSGRVEFVEPENECFQKIY